MGSTGIKTTSYVNKETGEYREKKEHIDLQFNNEGYLLWSRKSNVKTFVDIPLPVSFSWSEKGRIHELTHYILRDNQFLVYRSGNVIKPITIKELMDIFKMSERQCAGLVKKMKQENIIKEISFGGLVYFAFNPIFGFKGKRLSLTVYMFFQDELFLKLPKWVTKRFSEYAVELIPVFEIIK